MNKMSLLATLLFVAPVLPAQGAVVAHDCTKKPLMSTITKLDKSVPNTVNITGVCAEDVVIGGFIDLTLAGSPGAGISSSGSGADQTLLVNERSKVTLQTLAITATTFIGVMCTGRSSCTFRNVTVTGGGTAGATTGGASVAIQDQSSADILGSSVIQNSTHTGLGVFGASNVNIRPEPWTNISDPGPTISGHNASECDNSVTPPVCFPIGIGAQVLDGSFLRADNVTFSGNGTGVFAQRNAVIKVYANGGTGVVTNSAGDGIFVRWGSTAGLGIPISNSGGAAVKVGALTHFHDQGVSFSNNNNGGPPVVCQHVTAISQPPFHCGH